MPPGPISVTSRDEPSARSTSVITSARPTNELIDCGDPTRSGTSADASDSSPALPLAASSASSRRSAAPSRRSNDDTWLSTVRTEM